MTSKEDQVKQGDRVAPEVEEGTKRSSWKRLQNAVRANWRLAFTLVLLFLIAFIYLWKNIAVERAEEEKQIQKRLLTEKAGRVIAEKDGEMMRLTVISLSWAISREMTDGNLGNISQYFNYLVKEGRFRVILLARSDGTVVVSTDKGMEGFPVDRFYPGSVLNRDETRVRLLPDGNMMAVTPVMGMTGKLGVLLIVHTPGVVSLDITGT